MTSKIITDYHVGALDAYGYHRYSAEPRDYDGTPYFCTRCDKPAVGRQAAKDMGVHSRCRCHHLKRVVESKDAAMARRAHWLLKEEFDPSELTSATASRDRYKWLSDRILLGTMYHGDILTPSTKEKK